MVSRKSKSFMKNYIRENKRNGKLQDALLQEEYGRIEKDIEDNFLKPLENNLKDFSIHPEFISLQNAEKISKNLFNYFNQLDISKAEKQKILSQVLENAKKMDIIFTISTITSQKIADPNLSKIMELIEKNINDLSNLLYGE